VERLGDVRSGAYRVSADGSVIIGEGTTANGAQAYRWTEATGMVGLGSLQANGTSVAVDLSANGSVIVGYSGGTAFRWTQASGMVGLGGVSQATRVTDDGLVIVGQRNGEAFRWTQAGGMVGLGDLPGGDFQSIALGISGDGSVVVGSSRTAAGDRAFIWDAAHGMRDLREVLVTEYGLGDSLVGWNLGIATAISTDGTTIVGTSLGPGWIAVIPEPPPIILLFVGTAICLTARKSASVFSTMPEFSQDRLTR
jgi:probable HAF family extracellular repeat protein